MSLRKPGAMAAFCRAYPLKRFARNQIIIHHGDDPKSVYYIKSGHVKDYDISQDGVEQTIWLDGPKDIFPLSSIFDEQSASTFFYSAFSDVEAYKVDRSALIHFLHKRNDVLMDLTKRFTRRHHDLMRRLNAMEQPKAPDKIIHTVHLLTLRFGKKGHRNTREIALPMTHQDIASLVGLTRETVATELKKLKDKGCLYYDKWHFVVYLDKFRKLL